MTNRPPSYAHRLGRAYGPDNSRTALAGTLAADADGLECDVCLTADGELVLLHDPWLPFGTDLDGWAHERTAAELRRARLSGGELPLFVDELLAVAPRDLVLQFDASSTLTPSSPHAPSRRSPQRLPALTGAASRSSRSPPPPASAPPRSGWRRGSSSGPTTRRRPSRAGRGGTATWACAWSTSCSRARLVAALRRGGLSITTGTVNDAALLLRVAAFGVDAVTTDDPAALRARLAVAA